MAFQMHMHLKAKKYEQKMQVKFDMAMVKDKNVAVKDDESGKLRVSQKYKSLLSWSGVRI